VPQRFTGGMSTRDFIGGPGRTRTCNQTVMSGRISVSFVDFAAVSPAFDRVRCVLMRSFLVRNGCDRPKVGLLRSPTSHGALSQEKPLAIKRYGHSAKCKCSLSVPTETRWTRRSCAPLGFCHCSIAPAHFGLGKSLAFRGDRIAGLRRSPPAK
jgi:hypothetical protein